VARVTMFCPAASPVEKLKRRYTNLLARKVSIYCSLATDEVASASRRMSGRFGDGEIAATLNRLRLRTGAGTFLLALPLVLGVALLWQSLLEACGVPVRKQDVVELFEQIHSPCLRVVFVLAALVIAPVTEEIIFRGGIFRFLRNRTPRWVAILAPAVAFGASHLFQSPLDGLAAFVPLVALGAIFSIAYERTGRIGTTIVAHALFNLNTLAALLLGVTR